MQAVKGSTEGEGPETLGLALVTTEAKQSVKEPAAVLKVFL